MEYNITISPIAAEKIKEKLNKRNTPNDYLRLGVAGGGCNGYKYVIEYSDEPTTKDLMFTSNGIKVLIDNKSILYLNGSVLDWEQTLMFTGFKFKNPLETGACGCGISITIKKEAEK